MGNMDVLGWVITPAVVATVLFAALPLYDPVVRWTRRLKSDIQIASGLPDGVEKDLLNADLQFQARRLRLYRTAFRGRRVAWKWVVVVYMGGAIGGAILWPSSLFVDGFTSAGLAGVGAISGLIYLTMIGTGHDAFGRTPLAILRRERVRRHRKRRKRLERLDKLRRDAIAQGRSLAEQGSVLGFGTQVDDLAEWVRTWEMRDIAEFTGLPGAGLSERAARSLREKGLPVPDPYV